MKKEVGVVETGLEELSLKQICASRVSLLKKGQQIFGQENELPLRTILDPPLRRHCLDSGSPLHLGHLCLHVLVPYNKIYVLVRSLLLSLL